MDALDSSLTFRRPGLVLFLDPHSDDTRSLEWLLVNRLGAKCTPSISEATHVLVDGAKTPLDLASTLREEGLRLGKAVLDLSWALDSLGQGGRLRDEHDYQAVLNEILVYKQQRRASDVENMEDVKPSPALSTPYGLPSIHLPRISPEGLALNNGAVSSSHSHSHPHTHINNYQSLPPSSVVLTSPSGIPIPIPVPSPSGGSLMLKTDDQQQLPPISEMLVVRSYESTSSSGLSLNHHQLSPGSSHSALSPAARPIRRLSQPIPVPSPPRSTRGTSLQPDFDASPDAGAAALLMLAHSTSSLDAGGDPSSGSMSGLTTEEEEEDDDDLSAAEEASPKSSLGEGSLSASTESGYTGSVGGGDGFGRGGRVIAAVVAAAAAPSSAPQSSSSRRNSVGRSGSSARSIGSVGGGGGVVGGSAGIGGSKGKKRSSASALAAAAQNAGNSGSSSQHGRLATTVNKRRPGLPRRATEAMQNWYNSAEPEQQYPARSQRDDWAHEFGLTLTQVDDWFINRRRRDKNREKVARLSKTNKGGGHYNGKGSSASSNAAGDGH